jgi:hypothetical protein
MGGADSAGMSQGTILLYYTTQSNILVAAYFAAVLVKTVLDLKKRGKIGSSSYFEKFAAVTLTAIMLTLIVFWFMLAPASGLMGMGEESGMNFGSFLLSFPNLSVHLITPLLMLADYALFTKRGKLVKKDIFLCALPPIIYYIQATILGFSGIVYRVAKDGTATHFPYYFIDYDMIGVLGVIGCVLAITVVYLGASYLLVRLDGRLYKKTLATDTAKEKPKNNT